MTSTASLEVSFPRPITLMLVVSARVKPWTSFILSAILDMLCAIGPKAAGLVKPDIRRNCTGSKGSCRAVVFQTSRFIVSPMVMVYCWVS